MLTLFYSVIFFRLFFLILLFASANAVDQKSFNNCSAVPFCKRLRNQVLNEDQKFKADFSTIRYNKKSVNVTLRNGRKESLFLNAHYISDGIARMSLTELNTQRFELKTGWALKEEPSKLKLGSVRIEDNAAFIEEENAAIRMQIRNDPYFTFATYNTFGEEIIVLTADRLFMENKNGSQAYTFSVDFAAPKLYGLFDHASKLSLEQTVNSGMDPFRMKNSDAFGYKANSPRALYGSVPAIYAHSVNQTSGIFLHNAAEQWIDISYNSTKNTASAYFMVESAAFDLFVLFGPTTKDTVRQMTNLTGTAQLPQLWTLGYHQSRHSYKSQEDVMNVTQLMVDNKFPVDAIWMDVDHADGYRWFKWNPKDYAAPVQMQNKISGYKKVCVAVSDPSIKVDSNYSVYAGAKGKYFVQWSNGSDYQGKSLPGVSSWIDYLLPEASNYYSNWFAYNKFIGSTPVLAGVWNDMNEPAVFDDSTENTLPSELIHRLDNTGTKIRHGDVHNIYGLMQTKATYRGLLARDNSTKRPFILTKSHFAGSQRYAAMWTGENSATWEHLASSISQCLTGNLLGMVFCGADIGGFIGDPSEELLQRWYQVAAWMPFFRGHSSGARREPYLYPKTVQKVIRDAISQRYEYLLYIYTLFYEHTLTGEPIIRPLFYDFPGTHTWDSQFLIGKNIMAVPILNASVNSTEVFLPGTIEDFWYRMDKDEGKIYLGGDVENISVDIKTTPIFYRGGTLITRYLRAKASTFMMHDEYVVGYICTDKDGRAKGRMFLDDYSSLNYLHKKDYNYFEATFNTTVGAIYFRKLTDLPWTRKLVYFTFVIFTGELDQGKKGVTQSVYHTTRDGQPLHTVEITDGTVILL